MGILVHPLAFLTGGIAVVIVYFTASNWFTRSNAWNALNWYISVLILTILAESTFFLGADETTVGDEAIELSHLPEPLDTIAFLIGFVLFLLLMAATLLTLVFPVVVTTKAIFGTAWEYPFARDLLETVTRPVS